MLLKIGGAHVPCWTVKLTVAVIVDEFCQLL